MRYDSDLSSVNSPDFLVQVFEIKKLRVRYQSTFCSKYFSQITRNFPLYVKTSDFRTRLRRLLDCLKMLCRLRKVNHT